MKGRYGGNDPLNFFLLIIAILSLIGSVFWKHSILNIIALILLGYSYFRMLSKNIPKRYEENRKYEEAMAPIRNKIFEWRRNFRDRKVYKYLRCPHCNQELRVPRNKGKIIIKCKRCGHRFESRS